MVRKIRIATKKSNTKNNSTEMINNTTAQKETESNKEQEIPNSATCIRCYIKSEKDIQNLNNVLCRFNNNSEVLTIKHVGYKIIDDKIAEIDIAALHDPNCSVNPEEYAVINGWLTSFMRRNNIEFKFINFTDSYKNSTDCHLVIDKTSTLGEFITLEKGSVSDELFEYVCSRLNISADIVSISIPISSEDGIFVTYNTKWVREEIHDSDKKEEKSKPPYQGEDNAINISVYVYTEDASDAIDVIISKFNNVIYRYMYDYTEKGKDRYSRVIRMSVIPNNIGELLINSLKNTRDVIVSKT